MKYKKGDTVKIRTWESMEKEFGVDDIGRIDVNGTMVMPDMRLWCGAFWTIASVDVLRKNYKVVGLDNGRMWTDKMFEDSCIVNKERVVYKLNTIYDVVSDTYAGLSLFATSKGFGGNPNGMDFFVAVKHLHENVYEIIEDVILYVSKAREVSGDVKIVYDKKKCVSSKLNIPEYLLCESNIKYTQDDADKLNEMRFKAALAALPESMRLHGNKTVFVAEHAISIADAFMDQFFKEKQ